MIWEASLTCSIKDMLIRFLKLELKNSIKAVRRTVVGSVVMMLILTAAIAAVSFVIGKDSTVTPLRAAVILRDDDSLSRMVIRYISQTDSIKAISEFNYMDEDEAFSALDAGEADIVIDIPEDFYNNVNIGINTPVDIYMRQDAGFLTDMFAEVVSSGTGYVRTTEAAVYAFLDISSSGEYRVIMSDAPVGDYIAGVYAERIMRRAKLFDSIVISEYGSLKVYQFYFMALLMILMLYSGLGFGYLYNSETKAVEDKLRVYGVGRMQTALVKEAVMTVHLLLMSVVIYALFLWFQNILDIEIYAFDAGHVAALLILSISTAVLCNMIYSVAGDDHGAQPVILILAVIALLMSGMLIPYSRLPQAVSVAGRLLPVTYMRDCFEWIFFENAARMTGGLILVPVVVIEQALGVLWNRR